MIELTNRFGKVYYWGKYDELNGWVHTCYEGFCRPEEVIEAVKMTLKLIKESPTDKLLSDNSKLKGTWNEANEWIDEHWFGNAPGYGLKRHATIKSTDVFSTSSQEDHEKGNVNTGILMKSFTSQDEAINWLKAG